MNIANVQLRKLKGLDIQQELCRFVRTKTCAGGRQREIATDNGQLDRQ